jgi:catechol-2,3-dioxygenase
VRQVAAPGGGVRRRGGYAGAMLRGICELTLEARDVETLERFYTEAFGLEVLAREDDRVWLAVGPQARLGIWTPGGKEFDDRGGRHVHFAMSVRAGTLDRLTGRLRDMGAEPEGPVEHDGGDRSLYVQDPAGNVVEVWDYFVDGEGARDGVAGLADAETAEAA